MNWWAQHSTWSFSDTLVKTSSFFILRFVFFFISSDLAHRAPITTSVAVRLFAPDRDSCVLASCCGLPLVLLQWSILQFSLRIRIRSRGEYFHLGYSFFFRHAFFNQSQPWILWSKQTLFLPTRRRIKKKQKKQQHVWYVCVIRMHILKYISTYICLLYTSPSPRD